jgi:hypothetical protein
MAILQMGKYSTERSLGRGMVELVLPWSLPALSMQVVKVGEIRTVKPFSLGFLASCLFCHLLSLPCPPPLSFGFQGSRASSVRQ